MTYFRLVLVGMIMELCYLSLYIGVEGPAEVLLLILVNVVTFSLFSLVAWKMRHEAGPDGNKTKTAVIVLALGVLFRLTLVPHAVIGSDDIYRYLWDGRVAAGGINPFLYSPADPRLAEMATADLPSKVNFPEMRTVYPPLAQGLFLVSHTLFGDSVAGLKFLLVIFDCCTMLLLWKILRDMGKSVLPVVLYAWSPLPVLYFGLDGHIDALGILCFVIAFLFVLTRRPIRGAWALGLGALVKILPIVVVPFLFREARGVRRAAAFTAPILLVAAGYLTYAEPTWGVFESLGTFGSRWAFNGSVFNVLYLLTGSNGTSHTVCGVAIVLWVGFLTFINRPFVEKAFWGVAGSILLSPVVHPWYLAWLAVLLPLCWSTSVFTLLGLSFVANIVVYQYRAYGVWKDQPLLLLVEYLPVFFLLGREIARGDVLRYREHESIPPGTSR
jgi:alpha-1,6-mannosyltransferase